VDESSGWQRPENFKRPSKRSKHDGLKAVPRYFNGRRSISSQIDEFYKKRGQAMGAARRSLEQEQARLEQQANAEGQENATRSIITGLSNWTTDPDF
jgi:hypothetical protein